MHWPPCVYRHHEGKLKRFLIWCLIDNSLSDERRMAFALHSTRKDTYVLVQYDRIMLQKAELYNSAMLQAR